MSTNISTTAKPHARSKQFTLRQAAVWTVWISIALALLSQIGTTWGLVLWLAAGAAVLGCAAWRGWIGWIVGACLVVGSVVFLLAPGSCVIPQWAARRSACQDHLKQIVIGLHNYHDTYGCFPPAYVADTNGRPMHSWRVLLLPFIEHQDLYDRYDFSEPWDGPSNSKLAAEMPRVYRCPSDSVSLSPTDTSYFAVLGNRTIWPGPSPRSLADIEDGSSNTILVAECHGAGINWMEPRDLHTLQMPGAVNALNGQGICSCHNGQTHDQGRGECALVGLADGSVRMLPNSTPRTTINALFTIDGGETFTLP